MPLGDPYIGTCTANAEPSTDTTVRSCCNTGYARGCCTNFPGGDAPDAVRFGIVERKNGCATIRYVIERDHHPFDHGTLQLAEAGAVPVTLLERQAQAYLASFLRRADDGVRA